MKRDFIIKEEEIKKLRELLPEDADRLLEMNYDDFISGMDDLVVAYMDENYHHTDLSWRIERLMDDINWRHIHGRDPDRVREAWE